MKLLNKYFAKFFLSICFYLALIYTAVAQAPLTTLDTLNIDVPLYFTDALGAHDTIVIKIRDTIVSSVNAAEGEVNLTGTAFGDGLDVRIGKSRAITFGADSEDYSGKVVVVSPKRLWVDEDQPCLGFEWPSLVILANVAHYPLTVSWDSDLFQSSGALGCTEGTYIINTVFDEIIQDWQRVYAAGESYQCLVATDSINFASDAPNTDSSIQPVFATNQRDTVDVLYLKFDVSSPCNNDSLGVSTVAYEDASLSVYPNPVTELLYVESDRPYDSYEIISMTGQALATGPYQPGQAVSTGNLARGTYFLRLIDGTNNTYALRKFMRQ